MCKINAAKIFKIYYTISNGRDDDDDNGGDGEKTACRFGKWIFE